MNLRNLKSKVDKLDDDELVIVPVNVNIKHFNEKIGLQIDYTPLVVEQNIYTSKIVNVYIVHN